jgi:tRNA G10  N-methylase Trm11
MQALVLLNQQYADLALAEMLASLNIPTTQTSDIHIGAGWAIATVAPRTLGALRRPSGLTTSFGFTKNFGLTKRIVQILAQGRSLDDALACVRWRHVLKGRSYKVEGHRAREAASRIWSELTSPTVDVHAPDVIIDVIELQDASPSHRVVIGLRVWEQTDAAQSRRAHLLPAPHPSGVSPRIAKALLNILSGRHLRRVHDPCCGAGGFVIEAGLLGFHASGADIDAHMIARARKNAASLGLHPELRVADAAAWQPRVAAIIADLPFGKSTRPVAIEHLAHAIFSRTTASRVLLGTAHVSVPPPRGWRVSGTWDVYVHASLTRVFTLYARHSRRVRSC